MALDGQAHNEQLADGQRFLIRVPLDANVEEGATQRINLVLDWFTEVGERMGLDRR